MSLLNEGININNIPDIINTKKQDKIPHINNFVSNPDDSLLRSFIYIYLQIKITGNAAKNKRIIKLIFSPPYYYFYFSITSNKSIRKSFLVVLKL